MKFALVRGKSPVSSLIQWWTRSVYSHVAIVLDTGTTYEALPSGFVRAPNLAANNHGSTIDLLAYKTPLTQAEEATARRALESMVGKLYDYHMLLAFPLRTSWEPPASRRKLFCSEAAYLVSLALGPSRILLERTLPWKVTPDMINLSPLLKWEKTLT